jgi:hypothetical protein
MEGYVNGAYLDSLGTWFKSRIGAITLGMATIVTNFLTSHVRMISQIDCKKFNTVKSNV